MKNNRLLTYFYINEFIPIYLKVFMEYSFSVLKEKKNLNV